MASSSNKRYFGGEDVEDPQNGRCLKKSTFAQISPVCYFSFEPRTFCHIFHDHEDGWRYCDECGRQVHCGCSKALETYALNDTCGVTRMECFMKEICMASLAQYSSVPSSNNHIHLDNAGSSTDIRSGKDLGDLRNSKALNDELKNLDNAGSSTENLLLSESYVERDHLFLFEKKLVHTDCDVNAEHFLVPKWCAEQLFPQLTGLLSMPLVFEDTEGRGWLFVLRWREDKKSYVLDGTGKCIEIMRWNAGDTLKFYRRLADGRLIIELQRTPATNSASDVPMAVDGMRNP